MADTNLSSFIWSVADLLRGNYKQSEYGKVILPFTVLRRLDCVLEPTNASVLAEKARREGEAATRALPAQGVRAELLQPSPLGMKTLTLMGVQMNIDEFTPSVGTNSRSVDRSIS